MDIISDKLVNWINNNPYIFSIGHPNSGNTIMNNLIARITNTRMANMLHAAELNLSDYIFFTGHLEWFEMFDLPKYGRMMIIIRDPRDSFLGVANRWSRKSGKNVTDLIYDKNWLYNRTQAWKRYIEDFCDYEHIFVQYEKFCLNPKETLTDMIGFLNLEIVNDIDEYIIKHDIDENKNNTTFANSRERYQAHCLKWKRDSVVNDEYLDFIWEHLQNQMIEFGYIKEGHDDSLSGELNG